MNKLGEDFEELKRSAREIPEVREYLDREDNQVDKIIIEPVNLIGYTLFSNCGYYVYQNGIKVKMVYSKEYSIVNKLDSNFNWRNLYDKIIGCSVVMNRVLIDYNYTEYQNKKDREIIDSFKFKNEKWIKSTIAKITEASMRIENYEDNERKINK